MEFSCPSCNAGYNIDDSRIRSRLLKVRCRTCKHIFYIKGSTKDGASPIIVDGDTGGARPDGTTWYYLAGTQTVGPVSISGLEHALRAKLFSSSSLVWNKSLAGWTKASTIDELVSRFGWKSEKTADEASLADTMKIKRDPEEIKRLVELYQKEGKTPEEKPQEAQKETPADDKEPSQSDSIERIIIDSINGQSKKAGSSSTKQKIILGAIGVKRKLFSRGFESDETGQRPSVTSNVQGQQSRFSDTLMMFKVPKELLSLGMAGAGASGSSSSSSNQWPSLQKSEEPAPVIEKPKIFEDKPRDIVERTTPPSKPEPEPKKARNIVERSAPMPKPQAEPKKDEDYDEHDLSDTVPDSLNGLGTLSSYKTQKSQVLNNSYISNSEEALRRDTKKKQLSTWFKIIYWFLIALALLLSLWLAILMNQPEELSLQQESDLSGDKAIAQTLPFDEGRISTTTESGTWYGAPPS